MFEDKKPYQFTPVYIVNRDRLDTGFRQLVTWLNELEMMNIFVLDNKSTYPPLLDYYKFLTAEKKAQIMFADKNGGPWVFWKAGLHLQQNQPFIVTDPDVVPASDCPNDIIEVMLKCLVFCPQVTKIGPSLRIDNLPDTYDKKQSMLGSEGEYWNPLRLETLKGHPAYRAGIDTTFALYRPWSPLNRCHFTNYRLAPPYHFEHRPWYVDSANLSEEEIYYRTHRENAIGSGRTDANGETWSGC